MNIKLFHRRRFRVLCCTILLTQRQARTHFVMENNTTPSTTTNTTNGTTNAASRPGARRLWASVPTEGQLALLKEVQAYSAHIPSHGETMLLFAKVSASLNDSNQLPWATDAKHCFDRFRLLITQWRKSDMGKRITSGGGEEFSEYDQLCSDLSDEMADREVERNEERERLRTSEQNLIDGGEAVRHNAMNRRTTRDTTESNQESEVGSHEVNGDSITTPTKRTKFNGGEEMNRAISALENAEVKRIEIEEKRDLRDVQKFELDQERFQYEKTRNDRQTANDERRISIEEARMKNESERDARLAKFETEREERATQERREMMSIQRETVVSNRAREQSDSQERVAMMALQKEILSTLRDLKKN